MARRKSTPEEREARQAADRELRSQARELLTDPAAVAAMVAQLLATRSPKVLRYSLRNQAMLTKQASERGMTLTDVDTFRGWIERGRAVRKGERGLRIVTPKGREATEESGEQAEGIVTHRGDVPEGDQEAGETRTRFRMTPVFDIAQTEGIEDAECVGEAYEVPNPAAVLTDTLTEQLERLGYEIAEDPAATRGAADDGNLITVPPGRPVAELARALAIVVTAEKTGKTPSAIKAA